MTLTAFGGSAPLAFDVNTAAEGVIRCIPGISDTEAAQWLEARRDLPFQNVDDFHERSGLNPETGKRLRFVTKD